MSAEYQYKKQLETIIENAYLEDPKLYLYKKFYLKILDRATKSYSGLYYEKKREIRVMDIHGDEGNNISTLLHELAHHIDYVKNGKTGHQAPFYEAYKNLIYSALDLGYVEMKTLREMAHRNVDFNKVQKILDGYVRSEPMINLEHKTVISISNSFSIKETLRKRGYYWNGVNKSWYKEISEDDVDDEIAAILSLGQSEDDITLSSTGNMNFKTNKVKYPYYIKVENGYDIREELKAGGFLWNKADKKWEKGFSDASEMHREAEALISRFPEIKLVAR